MSRRDASDGWVQGGEESLAEGRKAQEETETRV